MHDLYRQAGLGRVRGSEAATLPYRRQERQIDVRSPKPPLAPAVAQVSYSPEIGQ